ncbi:MAG: hypothetical protein QM813_05810 [Verrucomicrobiota bacterium]
MVRLRYAIAIYLLIFAYIIVAAYKMGMVHEKPRVVTRRQITDTPEDDSVVPSAIEPSTVLEVRDAREPVELAASNKDAAIATSDSTH